MAKQLNLGGTFTFSGTSINVHRMGYGAMQLAGPQVLGRPQMLTVPWRFSGKQLTRA